MSVGAVLRDELMLHVWLVACKGWLSCWLLLLLLTSGLVSGWW